MDEHDKDYEKHLQLERIEMLRLKQGVQDEAELVVPEEKLKVVYTRKQKRENFLYHYKTITIVCAILVVVAGFVIYDTVTTVHADIDIMVVTPSPQFFDTEPLKATLEEITPDLNGDGKILMGISHSPIGDPSADGTDPQIFQANFTRFAGEMQMNNSLLIIADEDVLVRLDISEALVDLTELYPDNPKVRPNGFYIKGTKFEEKIGGNMGQDDIFIGLRHIVGKPKEKTQNLYDSSLEMLKKIIEAG